ncbi:MAG TPA: acetate--CoA ligase family protein [Alphaproteobacteria bacterium]|nr:acetate--CoA ligase family protein [Alphaproteobacteria bacterium]
MPDAAANAAANAATSLKPLFEPESIAVIGASDDVNKFGGRPIRYMKEAGYAGRIYPINPRGGTIQGLPAYRDIREAPGPVDLVVISVPAPFVVEAVRGCAEARAKSVVIFSSGFAEVGGEGAGWQAEIAEIARTSGMRVVGPNCMGTLNTHSKAIGTFSSSFEHGWPREGNIAIISQSGAVGAHTMVLARERGLGIRGWVTTGNECDVDVADCIAYCAEDPETRAIAAYVEGTRKPRQLMQALEAARRNGKAVVMLKVGASEVGAVAASSHTASLAGTDKVYDAVFRQFGAYRAHSLDELLDIAGAAAAGHFPAGNRLGIVTISGGVGVLSADTAAAHGLDVPELPAKAQQELKALMPFAAVRNPVDTTAQMLNDIPLLEANLRAVLDHGRCDAIMVFLTSVGFSERMMVQLRERLPALRQEYPDDLIFLSMLCRPADRTLLESYSYLVMEDPSRAIHAIAALVGFGESFRRPPPAEPPALPATARAPEARPMAEHEAAALLADAGIAVAPTRLAASAEAAVEAAEALGYPVVLKVASPDIAHKSDIGGVRLGLADAAAVCMAYEEIVVAAAARAPQAKLDGVLVAPMVTGGVEAIVGVNRDPVFGPVVMFGLGGIFVEVLKDVSFRVAPFGVDEARRMIREIRGFPVLEGVRGAPPADLDALAEMLSRLSAYAAAHADSIGSIDLNPVLVRPQGQGALALDALIVPR